MSTRRFLIAGNWKMNIPPIGSFAPESPYRPHPSVDVWVFPTFLDLPGGRNHTLIVGAQCGRPEKEGAFTGDVSMQMLADQHYYAVLCGHSERRRYHGETDEDVARQAKAALDAGLHPIVCVGETLEEREQGKEKDVVKRQIADLPSGIIIAYEPVWAIGTGKTAQPTDAQSMHAFIRGLLPEGDRATTRILYGGSMNAANAEALLSQPDVDGGLIGGASLKPEEFRKIVETAARLIRLRD
ncbi:MAG: triose-phosphate isomerase [Candidatus Peregrinibacteria bacterium]|nr:triose-phosphate isomerase [Candidatus Peregrinibacteria bacterium]